MTSYDLCIAWNWEYDADFVRLLQESCHSRRLSLLQVTPDNVEDFLHSLLNRQVSFRAFFDRASDVDPRFMTFVHWADEQGIYCINPHERASRSWDKVAMHSTLINAGLHTPDTIVLPSHEEQPILSPIDLHLLGEQFIIKPAHGGGGEGVFMEATSLSQVLAVRREHASDRYLLQTHIVPSELDFRPAWFRVLYCTGRVYPCWWNPHTHIYAPVTTTEASRYSLEPLHDIASSIAHLCGLDLFSTEIALTPDGLFVVVDYVNDQIDLRLQSKAVDGVPDEIVQAIAKHLAELVATHGSSSPG